MDTAKDELGDFSIATRFGKRAKIYHDKKWTRPQTVQEMLHQIEATRLGNRWSWKEFAENCRSLGLPTAPSNIFSAADLRAFPPAWLKTVLDDFERYRMILYES